MTIFLKKPYLLALLIATSLAIWLLSGQTTDGTQLVEPSQTKSSKLIQVRVREQKAQPLNREIILTGRTAPYRTATLRAEIDARVDKIGAQRGVRVKKGDLIVRLATDDKRLRLKEAQALVKQRELEYRAKQKLSKKAYQSQVQIAEALTLLESAKTLVKQAQVALDDTMIRAPFAGVLEQRLVEQGDYVSMGDVVAEVIDEDPFLIIGEISELQRQYVKLGRTATAHLVTGQTVKGKISLIAARADAATRTFNIEIEIPNPKAQIVAGITCEIRIPIKTVSAHKVSAALLSLDDAGILGVKTVDADNRVVFYKAEFARATADGIWLIGLPEQLRFITVGQGFVRPGDLVQPVLEKEI
jgi:multidrug efflux system membrane fusion protein